MFSFCPIHSVARDATVSKKIHEALERNIIVDDIVELTIVQPDENMAKQHVLVEQELLNELGVNNVIVLYDRDRVNKKMNDRLVINKLSSHLCNVCPICLSQKLGLKISK